MLDDLEKELVAIAADGHTLLDPSLDPFAEIAKAQPAFAKWRVDCALEKKVSPDGKPHPWRSMVLAEARSPRDAEGGNHQAKEMVVALAEKMANAALVAMRDPKRALADKLVSLEGVNAADRNEAMHEATIGAHVMNDYVESNFGTYDYVSRTFRGTSVENLSGMSQQMRNHDFDLPENVAHDRRHAKQREGEAPKQAGGFFYTGLTVSLQESLVEYSRHAAEDARRDGRAALAAHDAVKLARREERLQTLLNAAVDHYARAKELFNMWQGEEGRPSQRAKNAGDIDRKLAGQSEAMQLEFLREQIDMRVLGLGWTQFATKWSTNKDCRIGTVKHLRALLVDTILPEESVPSSGGSSCRQRRRRPTSKRMTPSGWARWISTRSRSNPRYTSYYSHYCYYCLLAAALILSTTPLLALFSAAELDAKADALMQRRVAAGISDPWEAMQGLHAPEFNQELVGKRIEVCWKYFDRDTDKPVLIWTPGRVVRVADGLTDKRSKRARNVLPGGALLWAWDADEAFGETAGEQWLILLPQKWNPKTACVYGWRFDPCDCASAASPVPTNKRQNVRRGSVEDMDTDDER